MFWMPDRKYILKLCLLGDGAVGKTSLVGRYVFDVFDDKYIMSFGTKVSKKSVDLGDVSVDLMLWDILGQKTHKSLHGAYYRGATGALIVCDSTRVETIQSLSSWVDGFLSVVGEMPVTILVNKSDLERAYPLEDVISFGESIGSTVYETSAKTGLNVEESFREMSRRMLEAQR
jgi:small GTP-binding protein